MVVTTFKNEKSSKGKVRELVCMMDGIARQLKHWQYKQDNIYTSVIEDLQCKLGNISSRIDTYNKKLESASKLSRDTIDIQILEPLSVRVSLLESRIARLDNKLTKDATPVKKRFATWRWRFPNWMINSKDNLKLITKAKMILPSIKTNTNCIVTLKTKGERN